MLRTDFDYKLPEELIAQEPLPERDESRMMVLDRAAHTRSHGHFKDFANFLRAGDVVVLNNTKVLSCKLLGQRATGAAIEALLLSEQQPGVFTALVRKAARIKPNETLVFENGALTATALQRIDDKWLLKFEEPEQVHARLELHGRMPLPPYIERTLRGSENNDRARYQTVYADAPGAVAAPTAGLHFTRPMLETIQQSGVGVAYITLHVGEGTFKPVEAADISHHVMHRERYCVSEQAISQITAARNRGGRIIAVGTTAARTLETLARQGSWHAHSGETGLFIHPPYTFQAVDALLTNFHLPCSTLLMLVSAFAGHEWVMESYQDAVAQRYRFYSYGDCMLIL